MKKHAAAVLLALATTAIHWLPVAPAVSAQEEDVHLERRVVVLRGADGDARSWAAEHRLPIGSGGYLGVQVIELTPELRLHFGAPRDAGVLVAQVSDDSPAASAGIRVGDVITALDGEATTGGRQLRRLLFPLRDADRVTIELVRERSALSLEAVLEERERPRLDVGSFVWREGGSGFSFETDGSVERMEIEGLEVDSQAIEDALERFRVHIGDPKTSPFLHRQQCSDVLQERLELLEQRLLELESQLDSIED